MQGGTCEDIAKTRQYDAKQFLHFITKVNQVEGRFRSSNVCI